MCAFWKQSVAVLALTAVVGFCCSSPSLAGKPGGGTAPGGTIYFRHDGNVWTMKPDGTARTRLPAVTGGEPSHVAHDGLRWFVWCEGEWAQGYFPDQQAVRSVWATSDTGVSVPLVTPPGLAILTAPRWAPDDLSVSFIGEQWERDELGQPTTVAAAGLYVIDVVWGGGGPGFGSPRLVAHLESQLRVGPNGLPTRLDDKGKRIAAANVAGHSWAPDQVAFAFGIQLDWPDGFPPGTRVHEIWKVDLLAEPSTAFKLVASGNGVGGPEWSPDGSRIGYVSWTGTVIYEVSNGRTKTLAETSRYGWGNPTWSPTGSHLVVYRWNKTSQTYDGMFRFAADLTGKTEIPGSFCDGVSFCYEIPIGWRD